MEDILEDLEFLLIMVQSETHNVKWCKRELHRIEEWLREKMKKFLHVVDYSIKAINLGKTSIQISNYI